MSQIDDLTSQIPIGQLTGKVGLGEADTQAAVGRALPALVGGMAANAEDPAGAVSLSRALSNHIDSLLDGGIDLDQVDSADGEKIVRNVFGDNEDAVVQQLCGLDGLGGGTMGKLLPMLAPLVMSFLARAPAGRAATGAAGAGSETCSAVCWAATVAAG